MEAPTIMKRCLITGVRGFVGRYLAEFLREKGYEIYGFDRTGAVIPGTTVRKVDLLHQEAVADFVQHVKPDLIFHLAAQSSVKKSWDNPAATMAVNVEGTKNLLKAVISAELVQSCTILVVSSAEIYGIPTFVPITEHHPLHPTSPYGESRWEQEKIIQEYREKHNLKIILCRSFPHTGPGQATDFVCSNFAFQIAQIEAGNQEPILRVGNLDAERDFTDVRDVVKAYYLLSTSVTQGTYNVCSGKVMSIASILKNLMGQSKVAITVEQEASRMRPSDIPILLGDNTLLRQTVSWEPAIPFTQTLTELLDYWRKQERVTLQRTNT